MKIVIVGAGALGAYFGTRWHDAGHTVINLVREGRAEQLRTHGMKIHSNVEDTVWENPNIAEDPSVIEDPDLVVLAVKGYHLEGTMPWLKSLVKKGAKVLPLLNGVEHYAILEKELGEETVLGGLAFIIATLNEKGHVEHTSDFHNIVFGPLHPSQESICEELSLAGEQAVMNSRWSSDILKEIWKKYMFITAFSGITTAMNTPIGDIRAYPQTFTIARRMLEDMQRLSVARGVKIGQDEVDHAFKQLENLGDDMTSSMHQDRRKGLPLELEHLHGGAMRLAAEKNLTLPYIETIYGIIKPHDGMDL
ncbi:2-dehydropantoate 2-reductase [Salimicrobium jeotgali]|uniref:2-dehydropantoate 2-reductase n=1 Tax=Salimicrobium jeotgali TaxID=1230341 RepID=K2HA58_9BACI|nr:ketopantoate reductase family protein [Salimicrobium jeotgali]AKG05130.1 2-dehydropantoate 2-reductase [Salimicrobium jeotgali]EKE32500.1 2-dehydropantoate 2-reductase [Salimicrobium jeotgali]MBM7695517.1 2-dehydropantoate 2-reductase [Salimicrobium jeotgali]